MSLIQLTLNSGFTPAFTQSGIRRVISPEMLEQNCKSPSDELVKNVISAVSKGFKTLIDIRSVTNIDQNKIRVALEQAELDGFIVQEGVWRPGKRKSFAITTLGTKHLEPKP